MKRIRIQSTGGIRRWKVESGETIEKRVAKMVSNEEPIKDSVPMIYTERRDGVQPEYNIRTDRFRVAMQAMDKVSSFKVSEYLREGVNPEENKESKDNKDTKE